MTNFSDRTKQGDSLMSCGHPESAVITDRDGTSYCGACEREADKQDAYGCHGDPDYICDGSCAECEVNQ